MKSRRFPQQQVPVQRLPQPAAAGTPQPDAPFPAPWSRGPAHQPRARAQLRELPLQAGRLLRGVCSRGARLPVRCAVQPALSPQAAAAESLGLASRLH